MELSNRTAPSSTGVPGHKNLPILKMDFGLIACGAEKPKTDWISD